jgi:large subunit ribosomal protein L5
VPGPFSSPRVEHAYHNIIAPDILTLCYQHNPPGYRPPPKAPRLRGWDDSSPYHANRQLRGPRGGDVLRLLRKPITFRNVPMIEKITVHTFVKQVLQHGSGPLHVAGMVLQAITNVRVRTFKSRTGVSAWGLLPGKSIAATATLKGEDMYHFLGKVVNVVLPRIKDWPGVAATSGDGSGNLSFGLGVDVVGAFPEVEINFDSSVAASHLLDALEMYANGF